MTLAYGMTVPCTRRRRARRAMRRKQILAIAAAIDAARPRPDTPITGLLRSKYLHLADEIEFINHNQLILNEI
jgi:hypothetical protein